MLRSYSKNGVKIDDNPSRTSLDDALWIDLVLPTDQEIMQLAELGIIVPSLNDMEEIELSNRLYQNDADLYMTVVFPEGGHNQGAFSRPATFICQENRLVSVRYHQARFFDHYRPEHDMEHMGGGHVFINLVQNLIGYLADIIEGVGRGLDQIGHKIYGIEAEKDAGMLQNALKQAGCEGEALSHARLALLTVERALGFFGQMRADHPESAVLRPMMKAILRDIQALEVHADFLEQRLALVSDMTLGMINLAQNTTIRILSIVATIFLPPTLIASIYGMNFQHMPELAWPLGYPIAIGIMILSSALMYVILNKK